jgi:glycosyltransferase involved in cell wall biosynthesis
MADVCIDWVEKRSCCIAFLVGVPHGLMVVDETQMKVLHVVSTLGHGGTEVFCRDSAYCMRTQYGIANFVLAMSRGTSTIAADLADAAGCEIRVVPRFGRVRRLIWLWCLCSEIRPDAILCHLLGIDHVMIALVARMTGVGTVVAIAGNPPPEINRRLRRKYSLVLMLSYLTRVPIVCPSHFMLDRFSEIGVLPIGSGVIRYGCAVTRIFERADYVRRGRLAEPYNHAGDSPLPFTIGTIARIDRIKDHETLIRAFSLLRAEEPSTLLRLRGSTWSYCVKGSGSRTVWSFSETKAISPNSWE